MSAEVPKAPTWICEGAEGTDLDLRRCRRHRLGSAEVPKAPTWICGGAEGTDLESSERCRKELPGGSKSVRLLAMNLALLFLALFGLSSSPVWVRWAGASNEAIGTHRLIGSALLMAGICLVQGKPFWRRDRSSSWIVLSGFLLFVHLWTYVYAAQNTSIPHLMILYSANPLFTALGALLFFKEEFPRRLYFAYPLAVVGLTVLMLERPTTIPLTPEQAWRGDWMAIVAALTHSMYVLAAKKARQGTDNFRFSFGLYLVSGLFYGGLWLVTTAKQGVVFPAPFYLSVAGLIVFPSILGHTLITYLLKHMNVNLLSCSKLVEPAISSLLAFFLFSETIGSLGVLAFALIGSAVLILFAPAVQQGLQRLAWLRRCRRH
ncbi:MAG: hypothetical protein C5B49_15420, partial [Bdellovibrio sp.]